MEIDIKERTQPSSLRIPTNNTSKAIDFLGVENFDFVFNPLLINVVNQWMANEEKFYAIVYQGYKFQNRVKLLKYSKNLFIWSRSGVDKEELQGKED